MTLFKQVYTIFLSNITDDLYSLFDAQDIEDDLENMLLEAIPRFEFPKAVINIDIENKIFTRVLTQEEINILAYIMCDLWTDRKLRDVRNIQLEYGDKDFALKSQSAHTLALLKFSEHYHTKLNRAQKLYNRRTSLGKPNYEGLAGGAIKSGN